MCYRREFKRAVVLRSRKSFPVHDQLRQAFDELDKDNSGVLSVDEVRDLLTHLDKNLTDEQQKVLIESMDHTGSGNITFDEFQSVFGKLWIRSFCVMPSSNLLSSVDLEILVENK